MATADPYCFLTACSRLPRHVCSILRLVVGTLAHSHANRGDMHQIVSSVSRHRVA